MTQFEFHQNLTRLQQIELMQTAGVKVACRDAGLYKFNLYQLDAFYVECKYHTHHRAIQDLNAYSADQLPEVYLNAIDITGLV